MNIDIVEGVKAQAARDLISRLNISPPLLETLSKMVCLLYRVFREYSARSVEINPVVLTEDGNIIAADCHIAIDEASVFKHPELDMDYPRDIGRAPTELERIAWRVEEEDFRGIGYFVQMAQGFGPGEGVVGFHGLGGGGAMLGADALLRHGLKIADYADTSGNPTASKVYRIVKIIFSQQWHHAHALVRALREELAGRPNFPVIILITGNKEAESLEILREGLKDLPARVELYGREYVYQVDYIAERIKKMVAEYRSK
jgi:succinyl-CoA synthetase beta subunit